MSSEFVGVFLRTSWAPCRPRSPQDASKCPQEPRRRLQNAHQKFTKGPPVASKRSSQRTQRAPKKNLTGPQRKGKENYVRTSHVADRAPGCRNVSHCHMLCFNPGPAECANRQDIYNADNNDTVGDNYGADDISDNGAHVEMYAEMLLLYVHSANPGTCSVSWYRDQNTDAWYGATRTPYNPSSVASLLLSECSLNARTIVGKKKHIKGPVEQSRGVTHSVRTS